MVTRGRTVDALTGQYVDWIEDSGELAPDTFERLAGVAELADANDSKSFAPKGRPGSTPGAGTNQRAAQTRAEQEQEIGAFLNKLILAAHNELPDAQIDHLEGTIKAKFRDLLTQQEADAQQIAALEQKLARRNIRHGCGSCGEEGCCEERDCGYLWKITQAEQERDALRAALELIAMEFCPRECETGRLCGAEDPMCAPCAARTALLAPGSRPTPDKEPV